MAEKARSRAWLMKGRKVIALQRRGEYSGAWRGRELRMRRVSIPHLPISVDRRRRRAVCAGGGSGAGGAVGGDNCAIPRSA